MPVIQILIVAFAVFALSRAIARFRAGELGIKRLLLWLILWTAVAVAAILPQTTSWVAARLGVGRGVDAAIYLSLLFLFYLVFRIFLRLEKIEHDLTLVVREAGLKKSRDAEEKNAP